MQFGIFTVGDVTPDPTDGRTPTEHRVRRAGVELAALMAARPAGEEPEDDVTVLERQLADLRFD